MSDKGETLPKTFPLGCKCPECIEKPCLKYLKNFQEKQVKATKQALKRIERLKTLPQDQQVQELETIATDLQQELKAEITVLSAKVNPAVAHIINMFCKGLNIALLNYATQKGFGSRRRRRRRRKW